ncbi:MULTISPECIES: hypothetical protein [Parageobacillus]|jgi:heme/copper-type cytochrome/quinol oxidase subunit 2|uniref:Heme/copper-type cytochrome/quinol oxidase subunit 2 n=2 Tax=Parageobacillus toebii TaxID=153151 RepID=A0AA89NMC9_9BACL|nr:MULTISPECIES: hypothetical protein [Parageobacillus]KYD23924.1 hypothetical protein B4110_3829 [Parageobacillus toebii]MBB3870453.1 heme/copper-type cytochrome/quinol oxidase subunit 2 [Parageobacillus toebii NBRC 107807]MED4969320.1 hypothetical protein [Parageobacillus toebii]MED4989807.1 hypothetical protein [Parageobacillus toebii]WMT19580.1 hypothetical protein RFB12_02835 [Parageobacillus toebii]
MGIGDFFFQASSVLIIFVSVALVFLVFRFLFRKSKKEENY